MVRRTAILLAAMAAAVEPARDDGGEVRFLDRVAPILVDNCLSCHNAKRAMGGYRVDTYARLMADSDAGRMIVPGDPEDSVFFLLLAPNQPSGRMPRESEPLAGSEIATLRRWIERGADRGGVDPEADLAGLVAKAKKGDRP